MKATLRLLKESLEAVKTLKTEKYFSEFSRILKRITVETALNSKIDEHFGYEKYQGSHKLSSRNIHSSKTLYINDDPFGIDFYRIRLALISHN